jgi:hypothetical protein
MLCWINYKDFVKKGWFWSKKAAQFCHRKTTLAAKVANYF